MDEVVEIGLGEEIVLEAYASTPNAVYTWSPADSLSCANCPAPVARPVVSTAYEIMAIDTVTGCSDVAQMRLVVRKDRNIYIPNAFSPNGDGLNDLFMIYGGLGVKGISQFKIYDRWGAEVHEAAGFLPDDKQFAWDGVAQGRPMPKGVYVYWAEVEYLDGEIVRYTGDVSLLR